MINRNAQYTELIKEAVEARRPQAIAMLQSLVRIPSITGEEGEVQDCVQELMHERSLDVDRWEMTAEEIAPHAWDVGEVTDFANRPNLAGKRQGHGDGRSIILNAHVDTVDPGDPALWSLDPYSGEVKGDRLYGRGACDMKGGLVTYLVALDVLNDLGLKPAGDITLSTTVGEEDGGAGALSTVLRGYNADAALITEPTMLSLIPAQGGSLVMRLHIQGKSAHGAVRDEGVSAIEKFVPIFQDLLAFEAERNANLNHPLYEHIENKIPISFGVLRSGTWASTVPETLVAEGRIGLIPGENIFNFRDAVVERIMDVANRDPWLQEHPPTIEWFGGQFAPCETPIDAPISQALLSAHRRTTGASPVIEGAPYGADLRHFKNIGKMDCIMYGAGSVQVAHHSDEHIDINEMLTATKTITQLLIDWCGIAE